MVREGERKWVVLLLIDLLTGVGAALELVPFPSAMSVKRVNYVLCHVVARQFIVREDRVAVH